jgi:hypothetical protein
LSGGNLQGYWDAITGEAGRIAGVGYHYHPSLQNSNSFIDQLLGLIGIDPMGDQQYLSPGSRTGLAFLGLGSLQFSLPADAWENLPFGEFMDPWLAGLLGAIYDLGLGEPFGSPPTSPLVVDLDGDGVELIGLGASEALFDLNVDGFAELTGWAKADDGFLACDRDGDGVIDDNLELFGTGAGHASGFLHLAELDSNGDGVIDGADADFVALSIWRDLDGDGVTDDGELRPLADFGIASIDLAATMVNETNEGNLIKYRSYVTYADGSTTVVDDVFFGTDARVAARRLPDGFVWQYEALVVPVLAGYGTVASTWVALSEDGDLLTSAKALLTRLDAGDIAGFRTDFESFVLAWAGVSGVAPGSRGTYVDARHLAFLEALYGQPFNGGSNPAAVNGAALEQQFAQLVEKLAARFMAQAPVSSLVLGTVNSLDDHPLAFLLPLAEELRSGNFRLGGPLEASLLAALDAIGAGGASIDLVGSALRMTRHDLGYADVGALGADLAATALAFDRDDGLAFELAATVSGMASLTGGETADTLAASSTATAVHGGGGDDVLDGGSKADWLIGGRGNDALRGGEGGDTYLYSFGDGDDVLYDSAGSTPVDRLVLGPGVAPADVTLIRSTSDLDDLTLSFAGGGSVLLNEQFRSEFYGLDFIDFADASSWNRADLRTRWLAVVSTDGDDVIDGFNVGDTITGGRGNDTLRGGEGGDTYLYNTGDGDDVVYDSAGSTPVDRLILGPGIAPADVTLIRSASDPDDLTLSFAGGGSVLLNEQSRSNLYGVDFVDFADGTTWSRSALLDAVLA